MDSVKPKTMKDYVDELNKVSSSGGVYGGGYPTTGTVPFPTPFPTPGIPAYTPPTPPRTEVKVQPVMMSDYLPVLERIAVALETIVERFC